MECETCKRDVTGTDTEGRCPDCARHARIKAARNRKTILESHGFTITTSCYGFAVRFAGRHVASGGRTYLNPDVETIYEGAVGMLEMAVDLAEKHWRGEKVAPMHGEFPTPTIRLKGKDTVH